MKVSKEHKAKQRVFNLILLCSLRRGRRLEHLCKRASFFFISLVLSCTSFTDELNIYLLLIELSYNQTKQLYKPQVLR